MLTANISLRSFFPEEEEDYREQGFRTGRIELLTSAVAENEDGLECPESVQVSVTTESWIPVFIAAILAIEKSFGYKIRDKIQFRNIGQHFVAMNGSFLERMMPELLPVKAESDEE
jgi:hypothetical protein